LPKNWTSPKGSERLPMATLQIVTYPNSVLLGKSAPVDKVDSQVIGLAKEMSQTMVSAKGIGLAAPQVGVPRRLITVDIGDGLIVLVNPVIADRQGRSHMEEGCLSCPGLSVDVERSEKVLIHGLNLDGEEVIIEADGLKARVLQHEIDHLNGVLIVDKLPWLEKLMAQRKLRGR
jgi:peptide deformylase